MKKKVMSLVLVFAFALVLSGCGNTKLKDGKEVAFKLKGKNFTADELYTKIKEKNGVSIMIDMIDKQIFDKKYKDDETIEKQVNNQLEYYKSQYSDNWDETLENAGYKNEDEFKAEIRLSYQREKAVEDYVKESIKEDEIKKYYEENTVGDISAKHILIKVDSSSEEGLTDEEAKEKAEELIKKLNDGAKFDELAKENSDDTGSKEKGGDLGYFNKGDMVKEFEEAAYALKVDEYTKEPVKTTYGYHIILKTGEKENPNYIEVKDNIIKTLTNERMENDKTIKITALDEIRQKNGLDISDSTLKSEYKKYIDKQIKQAEES